ncbi:hypothetical protein BO78DRAFT_116983 [Aspergillus sclerotiicarbonarius CBS 121057]|uniref:Uncharacterized protein n=1 Tax=Aspergillus sclerotiicarbonarius (strain CBS 121057 / IBT 28362) TaxID=1448318 RepID=A0A319E8Z8_ASPSB|nr:hypothetical protein BO78DRAFT_116983 [Aspergillus sclerotiicarbonarius CBS 121057]
MIHAHKCSPNSPSSDDPRAGIYFPIGFFSWVNDLLHMASSISNFQAPTLTTHMATGSTGSTANYIEEASSPGVRSDSTDPTFGQIRRPSTAQRRRWVTFIYPIRTSEVSCLPNLRRRNLEGLDHARRLLFTVERCSWSFLLFYCVLLFGIRFSGRARLTLLFNTHALACLSIDMPRG